MNKIKNLVLIFLFSIICAAMIGFVACSAGAAGEKGETGDTGAQGSQGIKGESGEDGEDALTTYEIYLQYYPDYTGTEEEFYAAIADGSLIVRTVTADYGGTTEVITVKFGDKISQPKTEDMFGYTYTWMCGDEAWNFTGYTVTEDITLTLTYSLITSGLQFTLNAEETACTVSGYTGSDTEIIIPETYNNVAVTEIGESVFSGSTATSITIPATVTTFGSEAFSGGSIEDVYYLGTAQEWAQLNFSTGTANPLRYGAALYTTEDNSGYTLLTELTLNATPAKYAFAGCSSITSVTFGTGATSTGYSAFSNSSSLKKVEMGEDVTTVYTASFQNCTALETVDLGKVTTLSQQSFMGCTALKEITIPDSVATIPQQCFSGCTALTTLTIGAGVTSTENSAFSNCNNLATVNYNGTASQWAGISFYSYTTNPAYYSGSLYVSNGNGGYELATDITISGTSIGGYAFYNNTAITSVTIESSVESIGTFPFRYTTALKTIYYNTDNIADIASTSVASPFSGAGASNNLSIIVGTGVTHIPNCLFHHQSNLVSVTIGNDVTSIGQQSFSNCTNLKTVIIGTGVTTMGDSAFNGSTSLTTVNYGGTASGWANISFTNSTANPANITGSLYVSNGSGYTLATDITIEGITAIGAYAFYNNTKITSVTIDSGIASIGTSAFYGTTALTTINYNTNNITELTESSKPFDGAGSSSELSFIIGDSVTTIPSYLLYNQTNVTSLTVGSGVTSLGSDAFNGTTALTAINYNAASVTGLTESSKPFDGAGSSNGLSFIIGDSVTTIPSYLLYNQTNVTSLTVGSGVTSLGSSAFYGTTALTIIYYNTDGITGLSPSSKPFDGAGSSSELSFIIGDSVTTLPDYLLYNQTKVTSLTVGSGITSTGNFPFRYTSSLKTIYFNTNQLADTIASKAAPFDGAGSSDGATAIIAEGITRLPNSLFRAMTNLTSVSLPSTLIEIGELAFRACSSLTSITIPTNVTTIDTQAFYNCTSLSSIVIGSSVTTINASAFSGCTALTNVFYGGDSTAFSNITVGTGNDYFTAATVTYNWKD